MFSRLRASRFGRLPSYQPALSILTTAPVKKWYFQPTDYFWRYFPGIGRVDKLRPQLHRVTRVSSGITNLFLTQSFKIIIRPRMSPTLDAGFWRFQRKLDTSHHIGGHKTQYEEMIKCSYLKLKQVFSWSLYESACDCIMTGCCNILYTPYIPSHNTLLAAEMLARCPAWAHLQTVPTDGRAASPRHSNTDTPHSAIVRHICNNSPWPFD